MKAYIYEGADDFLCVGYLDDDTNPELHWLDAKRAEWADTFAPYEPPALAWMKNGYTFKCSHCEHVLTLDIGYCDKCSGEQDEDELQESNAGLVFSGEAVYCGEFCQAKHKEDCKRRHEAKEACKLAFLTEFPYATVTDVWNGGISKCECFTIDNYNACLHWTVPGATTGGYANSYCGGCKKAWVCNGDLEAFNKCRKDNEPR